MNNYGYIYIFYNEAFEKDSYKIGCTKNVKNRLGTFRTSYLKPCEVKFISKKVNNYKKFEQKCFDALKNYRMASNREFFKGDLNVFINIIESLYELDTLEQIKFPNILCIILNEVQENRSVNSNISSNTQEIQKSKEPSKIFSEDKLDEENGIYTCNRCGYTSNLKGNIVRHLRSGKCEPIIEDINCSIQLEKLTKRNLNEKTYGCNICNKQFNSRNNKNTHQRNCKKKYEMVKQNISHVKSNNIIELSKSFQ